MVISSFFSHFFDIFIVSFENEKLTLSYEAQKDQEIEDRFRKEMGTQQLELKQTLATQLQEITSLKETVSLLQKNNEAKDFEMDLLKKEVETKENELGKKEREFENKRNELESKRAELESKRAELESKRAELDRKGREVDTKGFEVDVKGFELEKKKRELEKKGLELERKETELMKREIEGAKQAALPRRRVQFKPDVEVVDLTWKRRSQFFFVDEKQTNKQENWGLAKKFIFIWNHEKCHLNVRSALIHLIVAETLV